MKNKFTLFGPRFLFLMLLISISCFQIPVLAESPAEEIMYISQGTRAFYEPSEDAFAGYFAFNSLVETLDCFETNQNNDWAEIKYVSASSTSAPFSKEEDQNYRTLFVSLEDVMSSPIHDVGSVNMVIPSSACIEFTDSLLVDIDINSDLCVLSINEFDNNPQITAGVQFIKENSPPRKCYYSVSNDILKESEEAANVAMQAFLYDFASIGDELNLYDAIGYSDPFKLSYCLYLYTGAKKVSQNITLQESVSVSGTDISSSFSSLSSDVSDTPKYDASEFDISGVIPVSVIDSFSKLPLSGAKVVLHDPAEQVGDTIQKTGKDGKTVFSDIPSGSYEIFQQNELKGYEPCNLIIHVAINGKSPVHPIVIPNQPITGSISISVLDKESSKPVPNCEFGLFEGRNQILTLFSNEQGTAELLNVPTGKYTIKSINFPVGYTNSASFSKQVNIRYNRKSELNITINADIADSSGSISSENQIKEIHLSILPQQPSCLGQNGLKFGLFAVACENIHSKPGIDSGAILTVLSDAYSNELDVSLPPGTYCLAKVDEEGKCIDPEHCAFIDVDNTTDSIELDLRPASGYPVDLYALSPTGVGQGSTYLHVISEESDICGYTDDHGLLQLALFPGQYTAEVVLAPNGYQVPSEPVHFEISDKGILTGETTMVLDPCIISVKISDTYNTPVEGAFLLLQESEGAYTDIVRSDADGIVAFNKVPFGQYQIEELYPAPGYLSNKTKIQLSVDGTCHGFDQPLCTLVSHMNSQTFMVTDPDGYPLEHILFSLIDHSGSVLETVSTDSSGLFHFSGIPCGSYTIQPVICDVDTDYPSDHTIRSLPAGVEASGTVFTLQTQFSE